MKKRKRLVAVLFCIFLVVQQVGLYYARSQRSQGVDKHGNDQLALYEISQLEQAWQAASVERLITPEKLADQSELRQASGRLKEAEEAILNSKKRVQGVSGKKQDFFKRLHAYYDHSASSLTAIVDFLLAKDGAYSVSGAEINFESDADAEYFLLLLDQLSEIHQEKIDLDAYITEHNKAVAGSKTTFLTN